MNRRFRFRGHPLHPAITDFPIAILPLGLLWDLVALWQGGEFWWKMAFWTLVVGLVAALPTAITGFLDYLAIDRESQAVRLATNHMMIMLTAVTLYAGRAIVQGGPEPIAGGRMAVAIGLAATGTVLLGVGGWFGGELVFRHSVGVENDGHSESDIGEVTLGTAATEDTVVRRQG